MKPTRIGFSVLACSLLFSACDGNGSEKPDADPNSIAQPADRAMDTKTDTVPATAAEVEQAWKCRGLLSAANAAKTTLKTDLPPELEEISLETVTYWTMRAGQLKSADMTEEQENEAIANGTRVLATQEAIAANLPDIRACLAATKAQ